MPLRVAVTLAVSLAFTPTVDTGNVAEVFPDGTVTDAGTDASLLSNFNETMIPLGPAGSLRVTVPVDDPPPITLEGFRETDISFAGVTVNVAVREIAFKLAVIKAGVCVLTGIVEIVKVALEAPGEKVTVAGTTAANFPLNRVTDVPAAAAGPDRVTVPVDGFPPTRVTGLSVRVWRTAG